MSYTYVLIWMSISCTVILFNKWLLAFSGFPYPIALTLWHMFLCSTLGFLCVRVLKVVPSHNMKVEEYFSRVFPIGALYALSLWLSNSSYLYLSVSFIQMTKSLMPGLVFIAGTTMGTERFKKSTAYNMVLIAFGVFICALGEENLVVKGLIQQLTALIFEATRLTLIQILINSKGMKMNPLQSIYYISPVCMACLSINFYIIELPKLQTDSTWDLQPPMFLLNGACAVLLNLAVFLLIGKTSALTMNIAGVIKDWFLIFFSWFVFGAPISFQSIVGYLFCCSGVGVYNYHKLQAMKVKASNEKLTEKSVKDKDEEMAKLMQKQ